MPPAADWIVLVVILAVIVALVCACRRLARPVTGGADIAFGQLTGASGVIVDT